MPTFTTAALERLLDPTTRDSTSKNGSSPPLSQLKNRGNDNLPLPKKPSHIYISPALYTTPETKPIPDTPTSVSPSPYVYNVKRRNLPVSAKPNPAPGIQMTPKRQGQALRSHDADVDNCSDALWAKSPTNTSTTSAEENLPADGSLFDIAEPAEESSGQSSVKRNPPLDDDDSFQQPASVPDQSDEGSILICQQWKFNPVTNQSEFYDAPEEFSSDGSSSIASSSSKSNTEAELRAARIHLLEETERRKQAEEALANLCNQWEMVCQKMSHHGLSFPAVVDAEKAELGIEFPEQLWEEVAVARAVAEAVGRGYARAECEAAAEAIVDAKNHEIARLRDKLQYYEAVNHEMSLRNQEIVGTSRQERLRRKKRQKWMWTGIGASIFLGASILGYWYLPRPEKDLSPTSNESSYLPSIGNT